MSEQKIETVINEIEQHFINEYGNVHFSFWLSGDQFYKYKSEDLIFAASTSKLAYGLFFLDQLNKNILKENTKINVEWSKNLIRGLYKKLINKEKVDPYVSKVYISLTKSDQKFVNHELKKYPNKEFDTKLVIEKLTTSIKNKSLELKTILDLIFSKSSNDALDLMVSYYKNKNIKMQDETQKIVDNYLGNTCKTIINNSYKEKDSWNVSTISELIELLAIFIKNSDNHTNLLKALNKTANKYIEFNAAFNPILLEKSGWYPDFPFEEQCFQQAELRKQNNLNKYKFATFINCVTFNPDKDRYIGYSLCIGHNEKIGKGIIKNEGPFIINKLIEFI